MTVQAQDQVCNRVSVFLSVFGKTGIDAATNLKQTTISVDKDMDHSGNVEECQHRSIPAGNLVADICNTEIQDVNFEVYQKNNNGGGDSDAEYSVHVILDTFLFSEMETLTSKEKSSLRGLAMQTNLIPQTLLDHFKDVENDVTSVKNEKRNETNGSKRSSKRTTRAKSAALRPSHESDSSDNEEDDLVYVYPHYQMFNNEISAYKEMLLPFKRSILDEVYQADDPTKTSTIPELRSRCLLLPLKLSNSWSLIWVKFTKFTKMVEIYQFSRFQFPGDKLSYESQIILRDILSDTLSLKKKSDLMFSYNYVFEPLIPADGNISIPIRRIIEGYRDIGFNINPQLLPESTTELQTLSRPIRTKNLTFLQLSQIRKINEKYTKKKHRPRASNLRAINENTKRTRSVTSKLTGNTNTNANTHTNTNTNTNTNANNTANMSNTSNFKNETTVSMRDTSKPNAKTGTKSITASTAQGSRKANAKSLAEPTNSDTSKPTVRKYKFNEFNANAVKVKAEPVVVQKPPQPLSEKIVVTPSNLQEIKDSINYDTEKLKELASMYTKTYDEIEAYFLNKWSRVNNFTDVKFDNDEPPFMIYGPSQIEFEILRAGEIIATNTLKEKILKYNVTLNTISMRYLTSSRRWINQRFKLDPENHSVFYTRDTNLIVPDYRDVPYIVLGTHIKYGCLNADDTFDIIHQNWYISRKMAYFLIQRCERCHPQ